MICGRRQQHGSLGKATVSNFKFVIIWVNKQYLFLSSMSFNQEITSTHEEIIIIAIAGLFCLYRSQRGIRIDCILLNYQVKTLHCSDRLLG